MTLLVAKLVILFGLLVSCIVTAIIPLLITRTLCIRKCVSMERISVLMDISQGFGGGVLLGGGMLHVLPQANEQIVEALKQLNAPEQVIQYPWAPLLLCLAIATIYFVENILTSIVKLILFRRRHIELTATNTDDISTAYERNDTDDLPQAHSHGYNEVSELPHAHSHGAIDISDLKHTSSRVTKAITVIVLWVSISLHSLFAGLGLGSEQKESSMWSIFVAIISHKMVESFTLGQLITQSFHRIWVILGFIISFSLASPIGISIGIGIAETQETAGILLARYILLALASGAFINIAVFETLDKSHLADNIVHRTVKFVLFGVGFAIMAVIAVWA